MLYLYLFIYLFLAHLLADFVFQPEGLIAWKLKSWKGIFVHALILFVTMTAFFWPFVADINLLGMGVLLLNSVLHFLMDKDKIRMEKKEHRYVRLFFLDQSFHVVVLLVLALVLGYLLHSDLYATGQLLNYFSGFLPFALYLIVAVLSTYVYEIVKFQFKRQEIGKNAIKFNYEHMFVRLMVLSLIFGVTLFLTGFHIAKTLLG